METESKAWIPEVGKTAWVVSENRVKEVMVLKEPIHGSNLHFVQDDRIKFSIGKLFPTAEAALASIKIYDLEGKEVVIPRARPVFNGKDFNWMLRDELGQHEPWIDKLKKGWEVFEAYKASKGAQKPWDEVESMALRIMFTDEAGMLNYSWEQCLAMARREIGGGAAIGGKSDAREGGC